jgi:phosphonate metabolism transcriptional regulator PhnF
MTVEKLVDNSGINSVSASSMLGRRPVWRTIAADFESAIRSRKLNPGDKLPTEQALSRTYMVNRHTVRRALAFLAERGLVESTQGRGSFVRRPSIPFKIGRRTRFTESMEAAASRPSTQTLFAEIQPAEAKVARALAIKPGELLVVVERLGLVDGEPVSLSRHHFSHARVPGFIELYAACGSITQTLRDCGVLDYTRLRTRITARLPTPTECELLHLPRHIPLLVTHAVNLDNQCRPLEYGEARFAADRIELAIEMESGTIG